MMVAVVGHLLASENIYQWIIPGKALCPAISIDIYGRKLQTQRKGVNRISAGRQFNRPCGKPP